MSKKIWSLAVLSLAISHHLLGANAESRKHLFLYEIEKNDGVKDSGELVSSRVYLKYSNLANQWVYVLTDLSGQVPNPNHFLGTGTILMGAQLGAKDPKKHYQMTNKMNWEPTSEKPRLMIWKSLKPKRFELVTFDYNSAKVAMVSPKLSKRK